VRWQLQHQVDTSILAQLLDEALDFLTVMQWPENFIGV
jgi:hypothetical protein